MCQLETDKLPEKEKDEPQKKEVPPDNTETVKTKDNKVIELYDPSPYYLKD